LGGDCNAVLVEEVLREHPEVADCAVAAVSVGALVKPGAFVVLALGIQPTPDLAKLRRHVLARLPDALCPASFSWVADLPRTATGKIQRFQLRNRR